MRPLDSDRLDATLLDPDRMLDRGALLRLLAPAVGDDRFALIEVEPAYLRAKRGVSAMLGLTLRWQTDQGELATRGSLYLGTARRVRDAADKIRTLRIRDASAGPSLAVLEEPPGVFLAYPNDRLLRGLAAAADPRRLKNRLHALGEPFSRGGLRIRKLESRVEALRWKPGRRAVLRADLGLRHEPTGQPSRAVVFLRVYPAGHMRLPLARWRAAAELPRVGAPRVLAVDLERGFFAVEECRGKARALLGAPPSEPWRELAGSLRALYELEALASDLPRRGDRDDLEAARRALRDLALWDPGQSELCCAAAAWLIASGSRLPAPKARIVHGDLTADQVLISGEGVSLIDWDEASIGDPHSDLASLAVDLSIRAAQQTSPEALEGMAQEAIGPLWDSDRWRWQVALAWARRCLAGLQRGSREWRTLGREAVEASLGWSSSRLVRARAEAATHSSRAGAAIATHSSRAGAAAASDSPPPSREAFLRALLDPRSRSRLTATDGLTLTAVWPEAEGAMARLEDAAEPGVPALWLRLHSRLEVWPFPADPELVALPDLLGTGRFRVAGHRLARRAALREREGTEYLYLRPSAGATATYMRVRSVHEALARAGIRASSLGPEEGNGWRAQAVPGYPLDPAATPAARWVELGRVLARVHASPAPESLPRAGPAAAFDAAARQVALVAQAGTALGAWLESRLSAMRPPSENDGSGARRAALVHGDLHPAQVVVGAEIALLDWERAHRGDPEEDLGNFAAHLYWALGEEGRAAWRVVLRGYVAAGGEVDPGLFALHARLTLLRVLAIHSWRDLDRERCLERDRWERGFEECGQW